MVDDVGVGVFVVDGLGVMILFEVGLGLGMELCVGELAGIVGVGVGEVFVKGELLEAYQTTPRVMITSVAIIIRGLVPAKIFPAFSKIVKNLIATK
jgi:hypothetical protein